MTDRKAAMGKEMDKKGCTFILEIKDTQSQSWQGKIKWIEGQKEETFRSVLELISLLDSVIITDTKKEMSHPLKRGEEEIPQICSGI